MPFDAPVTLKPASRRGLYPLLSGLFCLAFITALLSQQPVLYMLLAVPLVGAGWIGFILSFSKFDGINLISIIFPSGKLQLKFRGESKIEGYLYGQQWLTSRVAVLRFKTEAGIQCLVVLAGQQDEAEYRRLKVWLRQGFQTGKAGKQVPGMTR